MPKDPQGKDNTVEEKLPAPIPSENKPAESDEPTLPDEAAERTKEEFEKLKEHNKELKEKLSRYEGDKPKISVLDDLYPSADVPVPPTPNLTQVQVEEAKSKLVDENGFVDVTRLDETLTALDQRARRAEERAARAENKQLRFEESTQVRAAHAQYPQLDPKNDRFDPKFYELVKNELVGQMLKGEQDIIQAAKKVSDLYTPKEDVSKAKEEAVNEYKSNVTKRAIASEAGTGRGETEPTDREELIDKTRKGDDNALYKRLQASGN